MPTMNPPTRPGPLQRKGTYPRYHVTRQKPRRWPLILRIGRGGVHWDIAVPVFLHACISALIVYLYEIHVFTKPLPNAILPSLSIVVGLMLVFRNQTSYERFWQGRHNVTALVSTIRNLARSFLVNCASLDGPVGNATGDTGDGDDDVTLAGHSKKLISPAERADTERIVRLLLAILYATKHNLRHEWSISKDDFWPAPAEEETEGFFSHAASKVFAPLTRNNTSSSLSDTPPMVSGATTPLLHQPDYVSLLPPGMSNYEEDGLGLPLQLSVPIEGYIRRAFMRNWIHGAKASQLSVQVNTMVDAIGKMEQIKTTPLPVAHSIHQRQVLAAFGVVVTFALVDDMGWWTVLIVAVIQFTFYGIEGIGSQLEDPFGYDRNDIKMDAIVEDTRREILVMLENWKEDGEIFNRI